MSSNDTATDVTGVPLTIAAARAVRSSRASRDEAYRERAWLIAMLGSCICPWPVLVDAGTVSGHDAACPSELMIARDARRRRCGWVTG